MSASDKSRIPIGKFGWLILVAVIAAPTAFFVLVTPKEPDESPAPPVEKRPLSKLESVGLRDYRDWDGLPEIFAVWADKAQWENDRTRFAYWHPGAARYDYFFEVKRGPSGYIFKEVPPTDDELRFIRDSEASHPRSREFSEQHPMLLFEPHSISRRASIMPAPKRRLPSPGKIEIQMPTTPEELERSTPQKVQIELPKKP